MGAVEDLGTFDPAEVAGRMRDDARVIERLLEVFPVEKQVDEDIRARVQDLERTREHLLFYAFLATHMGDLDRHADEVRAEIATGSLTPGHRLEDVIAQFG